MPRFHPGAHFGLLTIVRLIQIGELSEVYEVLDRNAERRALKLLAGQVPLDAEESLRLAQEAGALVTLNHAHVIRLYDTGVTEGSLWLLTEIVHGSTMREVMHEKGGALPVDLAVRLVRQACEGMVAAHAKGIVHRDLSPDNILVAPGDHAKVIDFASAKIRGWLIATMSSEVVGSPRYSAPEWLGFGRERILTPKNDVYSMGLILSEALTGKHPTVPPDANVAMTCILQSTVEPQPLSQEMPGIPWRLSDAVARALSKDPGYRWTMEEFAKELEMVEGDLQGRLRRAVGSLPFAHLRDAVAHTEQAMPVYEPTSGPARSSSTSSGPRSVSGGPTGTPPESGVTSRGLAPRDALLPEPPSVPETLRTPSHPASRSGVNGTQIMAIADPASYAPSTPRSPSTSGARTEPIAVLPPPLALAPSGGSQAAAGPPGNPLAARLPLGQERLGAASPASVPSGGTPLAVSPPGSPLAATLPLGHGPLIAAGPERRSSGAPVEAPVPRPTKPSRVATIAVAAVAIVALALTLAWFTLGRGLDGFGRPAPASAPSGSPNATAAPFGPPSASPAPSGSAPAAQHSRHAPKHGGSPAPPK